MTAREREQVRALAQAHVIETDRSDKELELLAPNHGVSVRHVLLSLSHNPHVLASETNQTLPMQAIPNDPLFRDQWYEQNTGQPLSLPGENKQFAPGGTAGADVDLAQAWNITTGSKKVIVAVIDSGIAYDHPDLQGNLWLNPKANHDGFKDDYHGVNFVDNNGDPQDLKGHGTAVAGVIAAVGNNGIGIAGVAQAQIMAIKSCGLPSEGCSHFRVAEGLEYAVTHGARIVNLSLGDNLLGARLENKIMEMHPQILFVRASGNGSLNLDDLDFAPDQRDCDIKIKNLICVAATNQKDQLARFSDYGAHSVALAAPGQNILTTAITSKTIFANGFENNLFTVASWEFTPSWSITTDKHASGTRSAVAKVDHNIATPTWLTMSNPINLTGTKTCVLRFALFKPNDNRFEIQGANAGNNYFSIRRISETVAGKNDSFVIFNMLLPASLQGQAKVTFRFRVVPPSGFFFGNPNLAYLDDVSVRCYPGPYSATSYEYATGTSVAAPIVAGTAALMLSVRPDSTVAQLVHALEVSGDPLPSLKGKTVTGRRLNAYKALLAIMQEVPPG